MAYAGGFEPGDAVRVVQIIGTNLRGYPQHVIGRTGVVAQVNPRIIDRMETTEVPVRIAVRANERTGKEEDFAIYYIFPEYLEKVDWRATEATK